MRIPFGSVTFGVTGSCQWGQDTSHLHEHTHTRTHTSARAPLFHNAQAWCCACWRESAGLFLTVRVRQMKGGPRVSRVRRPVTPALSSSPVTLSRCSYPSFSSTPPGGDINIVREKVTQLSVNVCVSVCLSLCVYAAVRNYTASLIINFFLFLQVHNASQRHAGIISPCVIKHLRSKAPKTRVLRSQLPPRFCPASIRLAVQFLKGCSGWAADWRVLGGAIASRQPG